MALGMPELAGELFGRSAGPRSSSSDSGQTDTCTESWCPW